MNDTHERIITPEYWRDWLDDPVHKFTRASAWEIFLLFLAVFICVALCCCCCTLLDWRRRRRQAKLFQVRRHAAGNAASAMADNSEWDIDQEETNELPDVEEPVDPVEHDPDAIYPAYNDGATVELFCVAQGTWLAADLRAKLGRSHSREHHHEDAPADVIYAATPRQTTRLTKVSLEVLRWPLQSREPCEIFEASSNRWIRGEVGPRRTHGSQIQYAVRSARDKTPRQFPAGSLRRRFDAGTAVQVYEGIDAGWVRAEVGQGSQPDVPGNYPANLYWKQIPIRIGEEQEKLVPSCLLRPARSPSVQPMKKGTALSSESTKFTVTSGSGNSDPSTPQVASETGTQSYGAGTSSTQTPKGGGGWSWSWG